MRRGFGVGTILAGVALLVALAGCTCSSQTTETSGASSSSSVAASTEAPASDAAATSSETSDSQTGEATADVLVYFMDSATEKLVPVRRSVASPAVARGAMTELLAGPSASEAAAGLSTAVPDGTGLLGISIEDGIATVDLDGGYESRGGTLSMSMRIAQVVFTLTQFPTVDGVTFELDGVPVTSLGGEGVMVDVPQTRADWEDCSPAVLLESPVFGATVTSPQRLVGTANVFEALFFVDLVDADGATVASERVMASSGTGTRGTFDVTMSWDAAAPGDGELVMWYPSAKDGSRVVAATVPVRLL